MFANWKSAVYEYAHRRNRLETDGDVGQLVPIVRDDKFVRRLEHRLRRMQTSREDRGVAPLRSETGMKIRTSELSGQEAVVELELRLGAEYEQLGRTIREERMERERITVAKKRSQWVITGVSPISGERRPAGPLPPFAPLDPDEAGDSRPKSVPYLNYNVVPVLATSERRVRYDRAKAQRYAETWWNGANPQYLHFEVDCTNFVSQCLFAGGAPMNYTGKRESGWWYQGKDGSRELWSYSWAVAHSLSAYLSSSRGGLRAETVDSPQRLAIGDVICYDWDGDGRFQHNTIVTGFDAAGMPLVNAHTVDSRMRYWDYRDSYAWTPNTRYRFFHIADDYS
ncbi:amidase domain-containing protein [Paenibacillus flagellatus]|uniref:Putative amidase domain-containing protein n=1 Tax=Paenibacillus flagellatus TaxID=2211139 RepID=A0A2V5JVM9_9BACL|nr:amidase domain-containing protein [Paenibacillus flagellatus]PYI50658.1 hypothetical protein DLM86_28210 [Paenibacillus flagellatus]